ncbi:hypothetical protein [Nocardia vulneris]|uniref:hypothetical protein n=1 Tax=Nocardia vulneris TaxID=1141657 RepID=UPI000A57B167|nr:hypothetical protein [Nocardia vulneris]
MRERWFEFFERTTRHPAHMHTGKGFCCCLDCNRRDPEKTWPYRKQGIYDCD